MKKVEIHWPEAGKDVDCVRCEVYRYNVAFPVGPLRLYLCRSCFLILHTEMKAIKREVQKLAEVENKRRKEDG